MSSFEKQRTFKDLNRKKISQLRENKQYNRVI